jgi:hypothetical protein
MKLRLRSVLGSWEIRFKENGRSLRAIKTVKDDTEITSTFDGDTLVYEHECKIEIVETNGFTVVKRGEAIVTTGPQKGSKKPAGSCITKLDGNKWFQAHGLRGDEKNSPSLQVSTKVEPAENP